MSFGVLLVTFVHLLSAFWHIVLPVAPTQGYACDKNGSVLSYKLNGAKVLATIIGLFYLTRDYIPLTAFADNFWSGLMISNILGLAGTLLLYNRGNSQPETYLRCSTADRPVTPKASTEDIRIHHQRGFLLNLFFGVEFNPRVPVPGGGLLDVKMFCYLAGAVLLLLNVLSIGAVQYRNDGRVSRAMATYICQLSWFVVEYMYFEKVHLYTYDLFAEKTGGKLFWGCFVFYPYFYCIGGWAILESRRGDISIIQSVMCLVLFLVGWILTRGSNMQKYYFKTEPSKKYFLFVIEQRTIPNSKILVGGFWAYSRHLNYLGEIVQALATSVPGFLVSGSWVPFLYPLYYVLLFIPRQIDDEVVCKAKYGKAWIEYTTKVPYRIVPYLY